MLCSKLTYLFPTIFYFSFQDFKANVTVALLAVRENRSFNYIF